MIKIIFFDLTGVLIKFNLKETCYEYAKRYGGLVGQEVYHYLHDYPHWNQFKKGEITEQKFYKAVERVSRYKIDGNYLKKIIYKNFVPNRLLLRFCNQLLRKGIKLGIISNMPKEWFEYIVKRWTILKKFDIIVTSSRFGITKGGINLVKIALRLSKKQKIRPEECLIVDDQSKNIEILRPFLAQGIVYKNNKDFREKIYNKFKV